MTITKLEKAYMEGLNEGMRIKQIEVIEDEIEFLNLLIWCRRAKNDSSLLITLNNKINHRIEQLKQLKDKQ